MKIDKDLKKFYGLWVAIDDKDRLLAYGKEKENVVDKAIDLTTYDKERKFRIYRIYEPYERQIIMSLLNDYW